MPNGTSALERERVRPIASHDTGTYKPMRSSKTLPATTRGIGPTPKVVDDRIRREQLMNGGTLSEPTGGSRVIHERHPLSGIPSLQELVTQADPYARLAGLVGEGVGPSEAIGAFSHGGNVSAKLGAARKLGLENVARVAEHGLEQRGLLGTQIPNTSNVDLGDLTDVLAIAQERYPRSFAHTVDIAEIPAQTKLGNALGQFQQPPKQPTTMTTGPVVPAMRREFSELGVEGEKLSRLGLSPSDIERVSNITGTDRRKVMAQVIGEHLLRSRDRLLMGQGKYKATQGDVSPIGVNTRDLRAAQFGRRFQEIVEKTRRTGGRSILGKNPRIGGRSGGEYEEYLKSPLDPRD